jgi:RNA polymerase sigma-70 factor, ECF subfamily
VLVERKEATSEHSKAPGIHIRTREISRQWGIEGRFAEEGVLQRALTLHSPVTGRRAPAGNKFHTSCVIPRRGPAHRAASLPVPSGRNGTDSRRWGLDSLVREFAGMPKLAEHERNDWFCDQVRRHLPELYATARRLTGEEADAEDLVAEAAARAWMHLESLQQPEAFRGWIMRILTNAFISLKRKRDARPPREPFEEESYAAEPSFSLFEHLHQPFLLWWSNPEQAFLRRLLREDLERAVDALPEEFRVVVLLCDVQGFSYREIAEALDVPVGTVKSRLSRGRSLLQRQLWEQAQDAGLAVPRPSTTPNENDNVTV